MKKILLIHQSADLYGSDKSFIQTLKIFKDMKDEITIVLPQDGPLIEYIHDFKIEIYFFIRLHKRILKTLISKDYKFLYDVKKTINLIKDHEVVYCNTIVPILFIMISILLNKKLILHVREIPPKYVIIFFKIILFFKKDKIIIFNSINTKNQFYTKKRDNYIVVYNGYKKNQEIKKQKQNNIINFTFVGRINDWKGYDILLEAFNLLLNKGIDNIKLKIVGSPSNNSLNLLEELKIRIQEINSKKIEYIPFTKDIDNIYLNTDILVVPSKKPEPFGRVAIEAMSFGIPVIATNHGGLSEIIIDNFTGFLIEPNSVKKLSESMLKFIRNKDLIREYGINSFLTFEENFNEKKYLNHMEDIFRSYFNERWR